MQVCNNWLQVRIDDHRIESDYKYKSELQTPEGKKSVLGIASAWWHRTTPMTTWPPRPWTPSTQRTWTLTCECAVLFVSPVRVVIDSHCTARLSCACHLIHACDERFSLTLSLPFFSSSWSSHSSFISCTSSRTSSTSLRAVASLCTPPKRVWTLLTTRNPEKVAKVPGARQGT